MAIRAPACKDDRYLACALGAHAETSFAKVVDQVNQLHFSDRTDVLILARAPEARQISR